MVKTYSLWWRLVSHDGGMSTSCLPKPFLVAQSMLNETPKAMNCTASDQRDPCRQYCPSTRLTQARMRNQSSAVLCFNTANRLTSLAAVNIVARTKVVVVTMKTALPREPCPYVLAAIVDTFSQVKSSN